MGASTKRKPVFADGASSLAIDGAYARYYNRLHANCHGCGLPYQADESRAQGEGVRSMDRQHISADQHAAALLMLSGGMLP